jgi:diguanylate cyclase (GGDEF)-like protein/PAS domain S-box-containing protein
VLSVLVVGPESLSGELGPTVLGRPDVERIHVEQPGDAREAAERCPASLVVLDLAAAAARRLVRVLRAGPITRNCAIVWLDRHGNPRAGDALRAAGVNEVIPVPVDPALWDRRLEELLTVPARVEQRIEARMLDAPQMVRGADEVGAVLLNIGPRGALIESTRELELGTKIGLSFALPGEGREAAVVGQVVRRAPGGEGLFRAGVEFIVYRGNARERIAAFVAGIAEPARRGAPAGGAIPLVVRPFEQPREWEEELRASDVRKALILDSTPESIVTVDGQGRVVEWNAAARRLFGYSRSEALGREAAELVVPSAHRAAFRAHLYALVENGELPLGATAPREADALRADGTLVPVEVSVAPSYVRGQLLVTAFVRDIRQRRRQERLAAARHMATRALTGSMTLAEAAPPLLSALVRGLECDEARLWVLEGSPERLVQAGVSPHEAAPGDDNLARRALETTGVCWEGPSPSRLGAALAVPMRITGQTLGALEARSRSLAARDEDWPELLSDVASQLGIFLERQRAEAELERLARYDGLTGLPNRSYFLETLQRTIARAARQAGRLAVVFVDLDGFKAVNDSLGHASGDLVLRAMADRLRESTRSSDVVARIGGDEFVVLVQTLSRPDDAAGVARTLVERLAGPCLLDSRPLRLGASAGIAVYPEDGLDAETLLRNADLAMYRAKQEGRSTFRFFTTEMSERALERQQLLAGLREALQRRHIELLYLPVFQDERPTSLEALVRWRHPRLGLMAPPDFLAEAEETGLMVELGASVLRTAARFAASWAPPEVRLVVNLSVRQLRDPHLFGTVRQAVEVSGLPPARLELDLPESAVMVADEDVGGRLRRLRELGVRLAIDEFGAGSFSVPLLRSLGIERVKLDRGLVARLPAAEAVLQVEALLAMLRVLGVEVVAEGIESEPQRRFFEARGVRSLQGLLFGPPLSEDAVELLLAPVPPERLGA